MYKMRKKRKKKKNRKKAVKNIVEYFGRLEKNVRKIWEETRDSFRGFVRRWRLSLNEYREKKKLFRNLFEPSINC